VIPVPKLQDHALAPGGSRSLWIESPWRWRSSRRLRYP